MPRRVGEFVPMESLPMEERISADREFQAYWYRHASSYCLGKRVLDAGAGMGYGRRLLLDGGARDVDCFDVVSLVPWVDEGTIDVYTDGSFDVVVAMDVIEHVEDDVAFLAGLLRVARERVFFSTPNWLIFQAQNAHHRREYTPRELLDLIRSFPNQISSFKIWGGDEHCVISLRGSELSDDDRSLNFGVLLEKVKP